MRQDDAALVAQVLGGDTSAFAPLIDRHRPGAIRLARVCSAIRLTRKTWCRRHCSKRF